MKYYHAENANRSIHGFVFEPYDIFAGTVLGVYATENESEIAALNKVTAEKTSGVTEITSEEYEQLRKKKARSLIGFAPSKPHLAAPVPLKGAGAAVVENPIPVPIDETVKTGEPLASVEEAVRLDKVEPSETAVPAVPKAKKK